MSSDPRILKSKAVLRESLMKLLKTRRLKDINIKEIAEQAGLSRPVFYAHFKSKEDLLFSTLDSVFEKMESCMDRNLSLESLFSSFFRLWKENASLLQYVFQIQNRDLVFRYMRKSIQSLMEKTDYLLADNSLSPGHLPYFLDFAVAGVYNITKRWVEEGMKFSPDEMGKFSVRLFSGVAK